MMTWLFSILFYLSKNSSLQSQFGLKHLHQVQVIPIIPYVLNVFEVDSFRFVLENESVFLVSGLTNVCSLYLTHQDRHVMRVYFYEVCTCSFLLPTILFPVLSAYSTVKMKLFEARFSNCKIMPTCSPCCLSYCSWI